LCGLNPAFIPFEASLYAPERLRTDRELLDTATAEATNFEVEQFLRILTPYFATRPGQKALEFLVRHYK